MSHQPLRNSTMKLYKDDHRHHHNNMLCGTSMMMSVSSIPILLAIASSILAGGVAAFENFPTSTRQALAQKAKELNPTSPSSTTGGGFAYTSSSWSNRAATVLTPICLDPSGLYTADRPFLWNSIDVGCRMTVIELQASSSKSKNSKPDLWVHSPVGLDGPLRNAMAKLGTVKYVVSPNYEHVKFAPTWHLSYPEADMCTSRVYTLASICHSMMLKPGTFREKLTFLAVQSYRGMPGFVATNGQCQVEGRNSKWLATSWMEEE
jgi:hypothetical protein